MISRLTLSSLVFAVAAAASMVYAASAPSTHTATVDAARHVTLERVVIVAKRLPVDA